MKKKSGKRTMFMSVLMSAPGPLIVGAGLMVGRSTTQLADFLRRSAELLALIVACIVYSMTSGDEADKANGSDGQNNISEQERKAKRKADLERNSNLFVGAMMCLSGSAMLLITLLSADTEKGNVIPGLAVAVLGVIANSLFWRKYTKLNRQEPNAILAVQSRLYRAKALVDICVTTALGSVALFPTAQVSYYLDKIGSVIVALYLAWCGVKTVRENVGVSQTFTEEKPLRAYQVKSRWPMWYVLSLMIGCVGIVINYLNAPIMPTVFTAVPLGVVFGGYFCFFVIMKLPRYYDENKICVYYDTIFRMNMAGLPFNNSNWPYIVRVGRIWSCATVAFYPWLSAIISICFPAIPWLVHLWVFLVLGLGGLFIPMYVVGKKYE